jgi:hypothetical protein
MDQRETEKTELEKEVDEALAGYRRAFEAQVDIWFGWLFPESKRDRTFLDKAYAVLCWQEPTFYTAFIVTDDYIEGAFRGEHGSLDSTIPIHQVVSEVLTWRKLPKGKPPVNSLSAGSGAGRSGVIEPMRWMTAKLKDAQERETRLAEKADQQLVERFLGALTEAERDNAVRSAECEDFELNGERVYFRGELVCTMADRHDAESLVDWFCRAINSDYVHRVMEVAATHYPDVPRQAYEVRAIGEGQALFPDKASAERCRNILMMLYAKEPLIKAEVCSSQGSDGQC